MPGLGRGFINVLDSRPGSVLPWAMGDDTANDRPGIQAAIYSLVDPFSPDRMFWRGGIVYFPPGKYRLLPINTEPRLPQEFAGYNEDFYVPPDVQLMFAPGASLHFVDGPGQLDPTGSGKLTGLTPLAVRPVVVNIAGEINAGSQKIFETPETLSISPSITPLAQVANVFFTGNRIVEVFPEWWGAGSPPDARRVPTGAGGYNNAQSLIDTYALQAALNAACNHRQWSPATGNVAGGFIRPPVPIRLGGNYLLANRLRVGARLDTAPDGSTIATVAPNTSGLILRGNANIIAGTATLLWNNYLDFPSDALAMLEIRGLVGTDISDVIFDAAPTAPTLAKRARGCVYLDGNPLTNRAVLVNPSAAQGTVFRRCTFRNATVALFQAGPPLPPYGDPRWILFPVKLRIDNLQHDSGGHDLLNLSFEQCCFTAGGADYDSSLKPYAARDADGVVLRAAQSLCVRFTGGIFGGPVRAMIRAYGGSFSLQGCVFHCQPTFAAGQVVFDPPERGTLLPDTDFERGSGADVFLAQPPNELNSDTDPHLLNTFGITTAGFSATQCESQSYQFLKTHKRLNENAGNPFNTTLTNVQHSTVLADPTRLPAALRQPPSIEWLGPGRFQSRLTLNGCQFSGGGVRVLLGPSLPFKSVLSMGSRNAVGGVWFYSMNSAAFDLTARAVVRVLESTALDSTFLYTADVTPVLPP